SITGAGSIAVSSGATLTLNTATIDGAAITDSGKLNLTGTDVLENGTLSISSSTGQLNASGTDSLDNETVTNAGAIKVTAGTLTLDQATSITGAGSIAVSSGATLTLNTATIDGAAITDSGKLNLTGTDVLENGTLSISSSTGQLNASGTDSLDNETVTNAGAIKVTAGTLTLDQATSITGAGSIAVSSGATLTLNTATIDGAAITDSGKLNLTGTDVLENGTLSISSSTGQLNASGTDSLDNETVTNAGAIKVTAGTLTLDQATSITGAGSIAVSSGATLTLNTATIDGAAITDSGKLNLTGTDVLENGTLSISSST